jgi:hypothetical protein
MNQGSIPDFHSLPNSATEPLPSPEPGQMSSPGLAVSNGSRCREFWSETRLWFGLRQNKNPAVQRPFDRGGRSIVTFSGAPETTALYSANGTSPKRRFAFLPVTASVAGNGRNLSTIRHNRVPSPLTTGIRDHYVGTISVRGGKWTNHNPTFWLILRSLESQLHPWSPPCRQ